MVDESVTTEVTTRARRRGGPPLAVPVLAWAALTIAAVPTYPPVRPSQNAADALRELQSSPTASLSAMLLLGSAVPLLVWIAAARHRLTTTLDVRVAGPTIGLVGGVLAGVALAVSALVDWTAASVAPTGDAALVQALTRLGFVAGGPMFAVGLGVAVAGVAVPSLVLGLLPRPLAILGLVVAAFGAIAVLVLVVPGLALVLPVVRFGGLLWMLVTSFLLPRTRPNTAR